MSAARARRRRAQDLTLVPPRPSVEQVTGRAQRGWWVVGLVSSLVAALGFQALSPAHRLEALERSSVRQDSALAWQQRTLDTIRRQVGQLVAGQCVRERDRMARVVIGC